MTPELLKEYRRVRSLTGENATQALRTARINVLFDELEREGVVRLRAVPDEEVYDDSYIENERQKKRLWERIEREGVWGYIAEYLAPGHSCRRDARGPDGFVWETADSIWAIVGDEWHTYERYGKAPQAGLELYYGVDLKRAAIKEVTGIEL